MSGKKEHKKGGKQYQQERKRKMLEEDSPRSWKLRRNEGEKEEKELEKIGDRPTPVTESHNSEEDSNELPDVRM